MMQSPITVAAHRPKTLFRRWTFLPLGVLVLSAMVAVFLTFAGAEPAQAQTPPAPPVIGAEGIELQNGKVLQWKAARRCEELAARAVAEGAPATAFKEGTYNLCAFVGEEFYYALPPISDPNGDLSTVTLVDEDGDEVTNASWLQLGTGGVNGRNLTGTPTQAYLDSLDRGRSKISFDAIYSVNAVDSTNRDALRSYHVYIVHRDHIPHLGSDQSTSAPPGQGRGGTFGEVPEGVAPFTYMLTKPDGTEVPSCDEDPNGFLGSYWICFSPGDRFWAFRYDHRASTVELTYTATGSNTNAYSSTINPERDEDGCVVNESGTPVRAAGVAAGGDCLMASDPGLQSKLSRISSTDGRVRDPNDSTKYVEEITQKFNGAPNTASMKFTVHAGTGTGTGTVTGESQGTIFGSYGPPIFTVEAQDQTATAGVPFSYTAPEATDFEGDAIAYSAALAGGGPLPAWLRFDPVSRTFSGTPGVNDSPAVLKIELEATDNAKRPLSSSTTFTLTVEGDTNTDTSSDTDTTTDTTADTAPTVADTSKFKTHYATVGQAFSLVLPAADADSGNGGPYAYSLLNRSDGTAFGANGLSFAASTRTLSGTPTAEATHELAYRIHDSDANQAKSDAFVEETNLKIVVVPDGQATGNSGGTGQQQTEAANTAPSFDSGIVTTLSVDENSPAGTNVGDPITATDPDTGDTVTYSLTGTDAASFDIGSSTGQITAKSGVTYNYEAKSSYSLAVDVSDGKGGTASTPVTVNLNNVNEAPSFAAASVTLSLDENSAAGTSVGDAVTASDPDANDTLAYSLSGTDAASFAIGGSTGQITTKAGVTYDYEAKPSYSLTVEATDSGGLSDSVDITVNLADATLATACKTGLGSLSAAALYEGQWDDANCKAHHQDGRARYFEFTVPEQKTVTISLTAGTLYVSQGTPKNGWGNPPKGTYEHRKNVRRANGKLLHDGSNAVTLTLAAGATYTVEAAGSSGSFTVSITPQ